MCLDCELEKADYKLFFFFLFLFFLVSIGKHKLEYISMELKSQNLETPTDLQVRYDPRSI